MPIAAGSGAEFARGFHEDLVAPLIARELPGLRYAAGRLGSGSDVLGYDDETSRDHDWGARPTVLVDEADRGVLPRLDELFEARLPQRYRDRPVRFATTWRPEPSHQVHLATVADFTLNRLGVDATRELSTVDWLVLSGQSVLEVTAGPVFVDRTATLAGVRERLRWYPPDVERYVLAAGWQRIDEYLPTVGRTGQRGDDLGSRLLCARLVEDVMRQAFLVERVWAPYPKWLGTRFTTLRCAADLAGPLGRAVTAPDWREREDALVDAVVLVLDAQRREGLPTPPAPGVAGFWDRPFRALDPRVVGLLAGPRRPVGAVEQWVDGVGVLTSVHRRASLAGTYRSWREDDLGTH